MIVVVILVLAVADKSESLHFTAAIATVSVAVRRHESSIA